MLNLSPTTKTHLINAGIMFVVVTATLIIYDKWVAPKMGTSTAKAA